MKFALIDNPPPSLRPDEKKFRAIKYTMEEDLYKYRKGVSRLLVYVGLLIGVIVSEDNFPYFS